MIIFKLFIFSKNYEKQHTSFKSVIVIHTLFQYFVKIEAILTGCEFACGIISVKCSYYKFLHYILTKNAIYLNKLKQKDAKTKSPSVSICLSIIQLN